MRKSFAFGKLWFHILLAAVGGLITFLANVGHNLLTTALLRSVYSFACLFVLAFPLQLAFRWIAGQAGGNMSAESDSSVGRHIDLTTPEETPPSSESRPQPEEASFVPLKFPRETKSSPPDVEAVTRAIRHLTNE